MPKDNEPKKVKSQHYQVANTFYQAGDYSKAREMYQAPIETNPNGGNYERWLECLDKLDEETKRKAIDDVQKVIGKKPEYFDAYIHWGDALYAQKKYPEAIEQYRKATEIHRDNAIGLYNYANAHDGWGNALFEEKKYPEATEQYRKATEIQPDYVDAYNNWGIALSAQKNYPEAINQYRKAIEIQPDYAAAYYNWGNALSAQKDYPAAIEQFRKAIEIQPDFVDAYNNWGDALSAQKNYPAAIEQFRKAIEIQPDYAAAYNNWGNALNDQKDYPAAIEQFLKAIEIQPALAAAYYNWGNTLNEQKNYPEAINQYRKAIEIQPDYAAAYYNWGNALGDQHRYQEAIEILRRATEVNPTFAYAYHNIAQNLSRQGKYRASWEAWSDSRRVYERARQQEDFRRDPDYFLNYGNVLSGIFGDYDEAEQNYQRGLELDPNHAGILSSLVNLYLDKADDEIDQRKDWFFLKEIVDTDRRATAYAKAWDAFVRAEELLKNQARDSKSSPAFLQLGELYLSMKQYSDAEEYFKKAFEADVTSPTPCADLGVLCMRRELFKDAIQHFEDARQRDPHDFTIRSNLAGAYAKTNLNDKAEAEYNRILAITTNHVESLIGLGELYTQMGDGGDTDMFDLAISHFTQAIQLSQSKTGSKRLKKKELAAVHYSRGYGRVKLYEAVKLAKDEALLHAAMADFRAALKYDSEHHKARRAKEKIEKRTRRFSPQRLAEQWGPLSIFALSLAVFVFTQRHFVFVAPGDLSAHSGYYAMLTFGALIFMVAGLYLPQILKLKVGGIELEKSSAEQIATPSALGITK